MRHHESHWGPSPQVRGHLATMRQVDQLPHEFELYFDV